MSSMILDMERNLFAILCGIVAIFIPNNKSNIHPVVMGVILSILATKIVYGDYDKGYQWSINDIYFVLVVGGFGALVPFIYTCHFIYTCKYTKKHI